MSGKKATPARAKRRKLTLKKETLKDLGARKRGEDVKGGGSGYTGCMISCYQQCCGMSSSCPEPHPSHPANCYTARCNTAYCYQA
jgi:hypothetical protein